jgi:hypothetical protein
MKALAFFILSLTISIAAKSADYSEISLKCLVSGAVYTYEGSHKDSTSIKPMNIDVSVRTSNKNTKNVGVFITAASGDMFDAQVISFDVVNGDFVSKGKNDSTPNKFDIKTEIVGNGVTRLETVEISRVTSKIQFNRISKHSRFDMHIKYQGDCSVNSSVNKF